MVTSKMLGIKWTSVLATIGVLTVYSTIAFADLNEINDLSNVLHSYTTLSQRDITIQHRYKRDIDITTEDHCDHEKIVDISQLDRFLRLHLHCQRGLFTKDFEAIVIDKYGREDYVPVDRRTFYEGFVEGESATSLAHVHFEDGNLVAHIQTANETYIIEPSWRHLPKSPDHSMIAYKASDIKSDVMQHPEIHAQGAYCGSQYADEVLSSRSTGESVEPPPSSTSHHRSKRALGSSHDTCTLMLVGDYRFFQNVGRNETSTAVNYMINSIVNADALYRGVDFGNGNKNLGFEIQKIRVHSAPTTTYSGETHYNMQKTDWGTKDLLRAFSKISEHANYCLAHLYTYTAFDEGVLGLSWIASPNKKEPGGICSPHSGSNYYNTAWSSMLNKYGRRILTEEANIVTAHEMGHSWGAQHDPDTSECAPSTSDGGSYIMFTYSVTGADENNKAFSPCSKRSITAVLGNKGKACFTARSDSFCGNSRIEGDEKCDAGAEGLDGEDPCCDRNCQLRDGAMCSDTNSDCCTSCQYASADVLCKTGSTDNTTCEANTFCTGSSASCPAQAAARPDGSPCIDNGSCLGGECVSFCESHNMTSCVCDSVEDSCYVCCASDTNKTDCSIYDDSLLLQDGKPCIQGYCEQGECIKQIQDLTDRLWDIIDNLSINYIIEFMKNNLVLVIVVLSLIIYVPLCIIVAVIDYKNHKEDKADVEWHSNTNEELMKPNRGRNIRATYPRRRNPNHMTNPGSVVNSRPQSNASIGNITVNNTRA